jgi:hypothetical protein
MPSTRIALDKDGAPTVLAFDDGWRWVWVKTQNAFMDDRMARGIRPQPAVFFSPYAKLFSLRDPDGIPHASLEMVGTDIQKLTGEQSSRLHAEKIQRLALKVGTRLLLGYSPETELGTGQFGRRNAAGQAWLLDGLLHQDGAPALTGPGGTEEWRVNGVRHRTDGPAVTDPDGTREWWQEGKRHRLDGPAVMKTDGHQEWWVEGKLHREDWPAIIQPNGTTRWYWNGKPHRIGGPAVETKNGLTEQWIDGRRIGDPVMDNWRKLATALVIAMNSPPEGCERNVVSDRVARASFLRRVMLVAHRRFEQNEVSDWTADAGRHVKEASGIMSVVGNTGIPDDEAAVSRCLKLAYLMARGEFEAISKGDNPSLDRLLSLVPEKEMPDLKAAPSNGFPEGLKGKAAITHLRERLAKAHVAVPSPEEGPVTFRHVWKPSPTSRPMRDAWAYAQTTLERLEEDEAPAFATLKTIDGGEIVLRRIEGVPYRPVLAPGGWKPIGEPEFRQAAQEGVAWADSPFTARPLAGRSPASVDERAEPSKNDRKQAELEASSAAAWIARAGRLVVIGGVVHRRTEEPSLAVVSTETELANRTKRRHRVVWDLGGDLSMTDNQATISLPSDRFACWNAGLCYDGSDRRDLARTPGVPNESQPRLSFPIQAAAAADAFLANWAQVSPDVEPDFSTACCASTVEKAERGELGWLFDGLSANLRLVGAEATGLAAAAAKAELAIASGDRDAVAAAIAEMASIIEDGTGDEELALAVAEYKSPCENGEGRVKPWLISTVAAALFMVAVDEMRAANLEDSDEEILGSLAF